MAILPLSGRSGPRNPCPMAFLFFLVVIAVLALASAAGWVSDSRNFTDWRSVRDGDRQPLPKL